MSSTQGIQAEVPTAVFGPVTGDIYQRQMGRWSRRLAVPPTILGRRSDEESQFN